MPGPGFVSGVCRAAASGESRAFFCFSGASCITDSKSVMQIRFNPDRKHLTVNVFGQGRRFCHGFVSSIPSIDSGSYFIAF